MSRSLTVTAVSAQLQKDVDSTGKQDPYLRASLDVDGKKSYQETTPHKNGALEPKWNEELKFELNGEPDLFVEIMDHETSVDAIIGYTAIPINQVVNAPGAALNGQFTLFDTKGNVTGQVNLILQAHGFQNSSNAKPEYPSNGHAYLNEDQQKRAKSLKLKESGADIALGAAVLGGAALLGKHFLDQRKAEEEEQ